MTEAEKRAWDAEIDAEQAVLVAATKLTGKRKRGARYIGCPEEFLADVCRLTEGRAPALIALCVYRQTKVRRNLTVTLSGPELADLGIDRSLKRKALNSLEAARVIQILKVGPGQKTEVTLLWRPRAP